MAWQTTCQSSLKTLSNSSRFSRVSSSLLRYSLQRIKQFCNATMSLQAQIFFFNVFHGVSRFNGYEKYLQKNSLAQLAHDVARLFASHAYAVLLAYVLHHVQQLVGNSVDSAREVTRPSHGHHALSPSHVGVCQPPVLAVLGKVSPCLQ